MTREQALSFLVFSVVAAGTPGPSNVLLTATGSAVGLVRGLPALVGVAAGMATMMFLVAYGLGNVLLASPALLQAVKWVGAAFLLWLAFKVATARRAGAATPGRPVGFLGAAAFQAVNPKSWLACASAAATFLDQKAGGAFGQAVAFGLVFLLASLPSCLPWLAFGAVLQRRLQSPRAFRVFSVTMGLLLAASVIPILR